MTNDSREEFEKWAIENSRYVKPYPESRVLFFEDDWKAWQSAINTRTSPDRNGVVNERTFEAAFGNEANTSKNLFRGIIMNYEQAKAGIDTNSPVSIHPEAICIQTTTTMGVSSYAGSGDTSPGYAESNKASAEAPASTPAAVDVEKLWLEHRKKYFTDISHYEFNEICKAIRPYLAEREGKLVGKAIDELRDYRDFFYRGSIERSVVENCILKVKIFTK